MSSAKILLNKNQVNKDGTHSIFLRLYKDRKKVDIGTSYRVHPKEWNENKKCITTKHANHKKLNLRLKEIVQTANERLLELESHGAYFTVQDWADSYQGKAANDRVFIFWEQLIERLYKVGDDGSARAYNNVKGVFKGFIKNEDLRFQEITLKTLLKFEEYYLAKGNAINSLAFNMKQLRALYNKAIKQGWAFERNYPFKNYTIRTEPTKKRAISKENITAIENLELSPLSPIDNARNYFLFSFYTRGMNFKDIAYLEHKDIYDNRIHYRRNKTGNLFTIGINPRIQQILDLYKDIHCFKDYVFPIVISDEYLYKTATKSTNKYLKDIAKLIELDFKLTTYVARHTWATTAQKMGVPISKISAGMGHATEETTRIYLAGFSDEVLDGVNDLVCG